MQRENRDVWISQMQLRTSVVARASEQLLARANVKKKKKEVQKTHQQSHEKKKKSIASLFVFLLRSTRRDSLLCHVSPI